jgi:hypothetical protein
VSLVASLQPVTNPNGDYGVFRPHHAVTGFNRAWAIIRRGSDNGWAVLAVDPAAGVATESDEVHAHIPFDEPNWQAVVTDTHVWFIALQGYYGLGTPENSVAVRVDPDTGATSTFTLPVRVPKLNVDNTNSYLPCVAVGDSVWAIHGGWIMRINPDGTADTFAGPGPSASAIYGRAVLNPEGTHLYANRIGDGSNSYELPRVAKIDLSDGSFVLLPATTHSAEFSYWNFLVDDGSGQFIFLPGNDTAHGEERRFYRLNPEDDTWTTITLPERESSLSDRTDIYTRDYALDGDSLWVLNTSRVTGSTYSNVLWRVVDGVVVEQAEPSESGVDISVLSVLPGGGGVVIVSSFNPYSASVYRAGTGFGDPIYFPDNWPGSIAYQTVGDYLVIFPEGDDFSPSDFSLTVQFVPPVEPRPLASTCSLQGYYFEGGFGEGSVALDTNPAPWSADWSYEPGRWSVTYTVNEDRGASTGGGNFIVESYTSSNSTNIYDPSTFTCFGVVPMRSVTFTSLAGDQPTSALQQGGGEGDEPDPDGWRFIVEFANGVSVGTSFRVEWLVDLTEPGLCDALLTWAGAELGTASGFTEKNLDVRYVKADCEEPLELTYPIVGSCSLQGYWQEGGTGNETPIPLSQNPAPWTAQWSYADGRWGVTFTAVEDRHGLVEGGGLISVSSVSVSNGDLLDPSQFTCFGEPAMQDVVFTPITGTTPTWAIQTTSVGAEAEGPPPANSNGNLFSIAFNEGISLGTKFRLEWSIDLDDPGLCELVAASISADLAGELSDPEGVVTKYGNYQYIKANCNPPLSPSGVAYVNGPSFRVRREVYDGDFVRGPEGFKAFLRVGETLPEGLGTSLLVSQPVGYDAIKIWWGVPPEGLNRWTYMALVRSGFGHPSTPTDGEIILGLDGNRPKDEVPGSLIDSGLPQGRWFYYTLMFRVGTRWYPVNRTKQQVPIDYEHRTHLYNGFTPYYQEVDAEQFAGTTNSMLERWSKVVGYDLDITRTLTEGVEVIYDADRVAQPLLDALGTQNFGFKPNDALGDIRYRAVVAASERLNSTRGTYGGLRSYVESATQYRAYISAGLNLMLLQDDARFKKGRGNWCFSHYGMNRLLGDWAVASGSGNGNYDVDPEVDFPFVTRRLTFEEGPAGIQPEGIEAFPEELRQSSSPVTTCTKIQAGEGDREHLIVSCGVGQQVTIAARDKLTTVSGVSAPVTDSNLPAGAQNLLDKIKTQSKFYTREKVYRLTHLNPEFRGIVVEEESIYYFSFWMCAGLGSTEEYRINFGFAYYERDLPKVGISDAFRSSGIRSYSQIEPMALDVYKGVPVDDDQWHRYVMSSQAPEGSRYAVPFLWVSDVSGGKIATPRYMTAAMVNEAQGIDAGVLFRPDYYFRVTENEPSYAIGAGSGKVMGEP